MNAHIRFNQFLFPPGENIKKENPLLFASTKLWVRLAPKEVFIPADCALTETSITCNHEWSFQLYNFQQSFEVELKKSNILKGDNLVASLSLPVTWFQKDSVVRYWYPMQRGPQKMPLYADISVHISTRKVPKFSDPAGSLLVVPSWQIPVPVPGPQPQPYQNQPPPYQNQPPPYQNQPPPYQNQPPPYQNQPYPPQPYPPQPY